MSQRISTHFSRDRKRSSRQHPRNVTHVLQSRNRSRNVQMAAKWKVPGGRTDAFRKLSRERPLMALVFCTRADQERALWVGFDAFTAPSANNRFLRSAVVHSVAFERPHPQRGHRRKHVD